MASEYLKQKAQRELEAEAPREQISYTRKQKLANWFRYHWLWLVIGAVLLAVGGTMLFNVLGIGRVRPDHIVACVCAEPLTEEQAAQLEEAFAALGTDKNGDGVIKVELRQYSTKNGGDAETALFFNQAADAKLVADITKGDSYFFITDDPYDLQRSYLILANADGSEPDEYDRETADKVFRLGDCPALSGLDEALSDLRLGRRWFSEKAAKGHEADAALWDALTGGAGQ